MQTICNNYTSAKLKKLAFSLLNTELCHLTLLMHEENLQIYALRKAFAPNFRSAFLHLSNVFNRNQEGPWGEQKVRQSHQQCDFSWSKELPFIRHKASLHKAIRDYQNNLGRLWIFYCTILCHRSYKNDIMLNAKNLSLSL